MSATTTLADINAVDWQPKLGAPGEVVQGLDDIHQCIATILATPKGTDPHRPTFGSDVWRHLDKPTAEAFPLVVREAIDAVSLWEPRIDVVRVVRLPAEDPANLRIRVDWRLKGREEVRATEVDLGSA
ncbi:MAG: GPW/gp25 family protein [Thalassobaculaceae bacterium]